MSAGRIDEMKRRLDALFSAETDAGRLGGASLAVCLRGERLLTAHWGTDVPDAIYRVYSMTKPVTALAAMLLYERGQIDLFEPVSKYLPAFSKMRIIGADGGTRTALHAIRLADLLNMTSGLAYPNVSGRPAERAAARAEFALRERVQGGWQPGTAELMEAYAEAPLAFEPGTDFLYGASADVLGAVIERAAGEPAERFITREILTPLGMRDAGFFVSEEKRTRLAPMFTRRVDRSVAVETELPDCLLYVAPSSQTQYDFISCGAGLYSTLDDYMRFAEALRCGALLGRRTAAFLCSDQLPACMRKSFQNPGFEGYGYGNFLRVLIDPSAQHTAAHPGEFGWDGLPGCYFSVDPSEQLSYVYMQQILEGPDWSLRRKMRQIIYGALE